MQRSGLTFAQKKKSKLSESAEACTQQLHYMCNDLYLKVPMTRCMHTSATASHQLCLVNKHLCEMNIDYNPKFWQGRLRPHKSRPYKGLYICKIAWHRSTVPARTRLVIKTALKKLVSMTFLPTSSLVSMNAHRVDVPVVKWAYHKLEIFHCQDILGVV